MVVDSEHRVRGGLVGYPPQGLVELRRDAFARGGRPGSVTEPHRLPMGVAREPTTKTAAQTSAEAGQRAEPVSLLATTYNSARLVAVRRTRTGNYCPRRPDPRTGQARGGRHQARKDEEKCDSQDCDRKCSARQLRPAQPRVTKPFGGEDVARHEAVEEEVQLAVDAGLVQEHHREQPGGKHREEPGLGRGPDGGRAAERSRPNRRAVREGGQRDRRGSPADTIASWPGRPGRIVRRPASIEVTAGMSSKVAKALRPNPLECPWY